MNTANRLSLAVPFVLGLAFAPLAAAEEVAANSDTAQVNVPIGPPDVDFITTSITVDEPKSLIIHYFAECQVPRGHIEFDILVNRSPLAITARQASPTHDTLSALCSNDGDTTESNLRAKSVGTTVACSVGLAATYTVRVRGHVIGPGAIGPGVVDDQSVVVEAHAFSRELPPCVNELPTGIAPP